jgi:hypothetical protein
MVQQKGPTCESRWAARSYSNQAQRRRRGRGFGRVAPGSSLGTISLKLGADLVSKVPAEGPAGESRWAASETPLLPPIEPCSTATTGTGFRTRRARIQPRYDRPEAWDGSRIQCPGRRIRLGGQGAPPARTPLASPTEPCSKAATTRGRDVRCVLLGEAPLLLSKRRCNAQQKEGSDLGGPGGQDGTVHASPPACILATTGTPARQRVLAAAALGDLARRH